MPDLPSSPLLPLPAAVHDSLELAPGRYQLRETLRSRSGKLTIVGAPGVELVWGGDPLSGNASGPAFECDDLTLSDVTLVSLVSGELVAARGRLRCARVTFDACGGPQDRWGAAVVARGEARLEACRWRWHGGAYLAVESRGAAQVIGGQAESGWGWMARDEASLTLLECRVKGGLGAVWAGGGAPRVVVEKLRVEATEGPALEVRGQSRLTATELQIEGARAGLELREEAQAEWTGGAVRGSKVAGIAVSGQARLTLREVTLTENGWAGLVVDEQGEVDGAGLQLTRNCHGALARGASRLRLASSTVEENASRGLEATDQAELSETDNRVGSHPEGDRLSWHLARTSGADFEAGDFPVGERLAWVRQRLERVGEWAASRRALLHSLPAVLAEVEGGPAFAQALLRDEAEVVRQGWAAVVAGLAFDQAPELGAVKAALGLSAPPAPVFAVAWRVGLEGRGQALALDEDGATAWTGSGSGEVRAWREGAQVGGWKEPWAIDALHLGHGRIAVGGGAARLYDREGTRLAEWSTSGEAVHDLQVVAPDTLDLSVVESTGHPTDRCGWYLRLRVGSRDREVRAQLQGEPPPIDKPAVAPSAAGSGFRCEGWKLAWVDEQGVTQAQWDAPSRVLRSVLVSDGAFLLTENELLRVVLRRP